MEEREKERCVSRLKFLSKFYITVIEVSEISISIKDIDFYAKQTQMISAESKFLANRDDMISYREWTTSKIKVYYKLIVYLGLL